MRANGLFVCAVKQDKLGHVFAIVVLAYFQMIDDEDT